VQRPPARPPLLKISVQAAAFNQHQERLVVDAGQAELQDALTQAAEREAADALSPAATLAPEDMARKISGRVTYVLLRVGEQFRPRPVGQEPSVTWGYIDHDRGTSQEVRVAIRSSAGRDQRYGGDRLACLQEAFGLQPEELHAFNWCESHADLAIAGMLGFTITDIWLQYP
jgi:hypothetical protein